MEHIHRVLFVCHGNICRSPLAEFLFKDMVKKEGCADRFVIASAGTSREELGNPVHPGTRKKLAQDHISAAGKYAVQLKQSDYEKYERDLRYGQANTAIFCTSLAVIRRAKCIACWILPSSPRDIADPWYTGDFDQAYNDIKAGCTALLKHLRRF